MPLADITLREILAVTTFSGLALLNIWFLATGRVVPRATMLERVADVKEQLEARLRDKDVLIDRAVNGWEGSTEAQKQLSEVVKAAVDRLDARLRRQS